MSQNERPYNEELSFVMFNGRTRKKLKSICNDLKKASSKLDKLLDEDTVDLIRNNSDIKELLTSINEKCDYLNDKIK